MPLPNHTFQMVGTEWEVPSGTVGGDELDVGCGQVWLFDIHAVTVWVSERYGDGALGAHYTQRKHHRKYPTHPSISIIFSNTSNGYCSFKMPAFGTTQCPPITPSGGSRTYLPTQSNPSA